MPLFLGCQWYRLAVEVCLIGRLRFLAGVRADGLNAWPGLRRVGGIRDDDPIAMAVERQLTVKLTLPFGLIRVEVGSHCSSVRVSLVW